MARSLGTLTLDLIANIGGYTAGLDKAERETRKRTAAIEKGFAKIGTAVGAAFATIPIASVAALGAFDQLVKSAGDFQDIAEKIGGSAEGIASFAVAAGTAGVEINTIAAASVKLTKALVGVDDESKDAGAALAYLGFNIKEFKELSPEDQIEQIAKAMAQLDEGTDRTAVAMALFGKSGAELIPFLKALNEQGGRTVILTEKQIQLADEYADRQAKTRTELSLYAQALATQALPALSTLNEALTDFVKELLGVDSVTKDLRNSAAIQDFAETAIRSLAFMADAVQGVVVGVGRLGEFLGATAAAAAALIRGDFAGVKAIRDAYEKSLSKDWFNSIGARFDALLDKQRQMQAMRRLEDRGFTPSIGSGRRFSGKEDSAGKTAKDRQSEADRYLEALQKQLEKTMDLSVAEQVLIDIQSGRLGKVTEKQKEQLLLTAQQIDAAKAQEAAEKEAAKRLEERNREVERLYNEAQRITQSVETPIETLNRKLEENKRLVEQNPFLSGETIDRLDAKAWDDFNKSFEDTNKKLKTQKSFAEELGLTFTSAFESAINEGKKFSDVLRAIEKDIIAMATRKFITEPFANWFGEATKGSSDGGNLGSSLMSAFGEIFAGFFAGGGKIPAGQVGVVGEAGPEFVTGPANVTPMSGGVVVNQSFSFSGPVDRRTQLQVAAEAAAGAQRALARNG